MSFEVLDWRRQVANIYREIRRLSDPIEAHAFWCSSRNDLLLRHPASPLAPSARALLAVPKYFPYEASFRFEVEVEPAEPLQLRVETTADGVIPFTRLGRVVLGHLGQLDVWWLESYGGGVFLPVKIPIRKPTAAVAMCSIPSKEQISAALASASSSISTSPTTRPVPMTQVGRVHLHQKETSSRLRFPQAS